ncbi:uncharacterized protein LOC119593813 [Penaeus monodon]|uniref:uncharacterized protein LOC119593813 n=1 Tax=Penaeus monodon TaxID=6687 RepID=UPI0018A7C323|nr:uncharacterized protein LOC119593813 [Penaeus monodon]
MAFKGVFYTVFFALVASSLAAEKKEKETEDGRFFLTGTGNNANTSITVSSDVIYLLAILAFGLIAAAIVAAIIGVGVGTGTSDYSYAAPTSYAAYSAPAPAYEESSYAVHRSLEEGAKKFQ